MTKLNSEYIFIVLLQLKLGVWLLTGKCIYHAPSVKLRIIVRDTNGMS